MGQIQITYIQFQNKIEYYQLPLFRGAVINLFDENILFHNHITNKLRYSYPLIQYKRINGYASILGINEGADALKTISIADNFTCSLGEQNCYLKPQSITSEVFSIDFVDTPVNYQLYGWLPLNQENYQVFQKLSLLSERINMLEKILIGNILSFAKGVGVHLGSTVTCKLMDIEAQHLVPYKGVELMSFNVSFQSNLLLPKYIGLGKGTSINHGIILHIK